MVLLVLVFHWFLVVLLVLVAPTFLMVLVVPTFLMVPVVPVVPTFLVPTFLVVPGPQWNQCFLSILVIPFILNGC